MLNVHHTRGCIEEQSQRQLGNPSVPRRAVHSVNEVQFHHRMNFPSRVARKILSPV